MQGGAHSTFHCFERSCEELTLLENYDIPFSESIGLASSKVNLHFETMVLHYLTKLFAI